MKHLGGGESLRVSIITGRPLEPELDNASGGKGEVTKKLNRILIASVRENTVFLFKRENE